MLTLGVPRSDWYIVPFLAQIGWLRGDALREYQHKQASHSHKKSFGSQQHRMVPNRSWAREQ